LKGGFAMTGVWSHDDAEAVVMSSVEGQPMSSPAVVRVLAESPVMLLTEVTMSGTSPPHVHDHDSVGYVVSGAVRMSVAGEEYELGPGDGFHHPAGIEHQMVVLSSPTVWIEVKAPPVRTWLTPSDAGIGAPIVGTGPRASIS
jgi:quercetin dioxygenase-like cupin family protein